MALSAEFVELLACPESKSPLLYFSDGESNSEPNAHFLFCPVSRLRFRIENDVPVLLVDDAERLSEGDAARLLDHAKQLGIARS